MTRPAREFELVRFYVDWGLNNCQIERLTGISRTVVREWRKRAAAGLTNSSLQKAGESACPICAQGRLNEKSYAYLLGIYLGDGHIAHCPKGVYRPTIVQDQKYIGLISECNEAIESLIGDHPIHVGFQQCEGCIHINSHWKHWPCVFPQHGVGSNESSDIKRLFCGACDQLGISWRRMNRKSISIARRGTSRRWTQSWGRNTDPT